MDVGTLIFWGLLVLVVLFFWGFTGVPSDSSVVKIVDASVPGNINRTLPVKLPVSFNQPEGLTYSYTAWVLVKDYGKGYGTQRRIFTKGDAPGLYIDSTSNSLIFSIKTFGATETILIPDVPAMKWMHIGLVVDQQAVDIYINGILRQHHTLGQLPKQNEDPVQIGPGWDGVLGKLTYYSRSLKHTEIKKMATESVPDDLQNEPSVPQYFDISWYIGRFYSK